MWFQTILKIVASIFIVAILLVYCYICGRISSDIVRKKNSKENAILWFWLGFFAGVIGVFATCVVKEEKEDK